MIRPARRGDWPGIRALIALYPKQLVQKPVPKLGSFFVAESEGRLVGCCALEIFSRRIAEIRSLSVAEGHTRQGLATALVAACVRRAQRKRIREVITITSRVRLFKRSGFSTFNKEKIALFRIFE